MMVNRLFSILLALSLVGALPLQADQSEAARNAFRETKAKADKGDPQAQLTLGTMYATGSGVSPDPAKAFKWHRKAAEQGLAQAQYQLALDYTRSIGVKEDEDEAAIWYQKAAEQDLVDAQISTGLCYLYGKGVGVNGAEALSWFRKAADRGSLQAEYQIGQCCLEGIGIAKDIVEGVKWTRQAAEGGYAPAQDCLGTLYEKGNGVEKDLVQAYKWYSLAAAQDDRRAFDIRVRLAKVEGALTKEQIAVAQSAAREFKPTRPGSDTLNPSKPDVAAGADSQTGFVNVNAQDDSAEVFADGAFVGNSPAKLKLKAGTCTIEVKKSGFKTYRRELTVTAGSELNLRVTLEKE